jgi:hypothetical protein
MAREFKELALDGHNYPTWALDIKISLASKNILSALLPPNERVEPPHDAYKYNTLYIIRHHLHPDLLQAENHDERMIKKIISNVVLELLLCQKTSPRTLIIQRSANATSIRISKIQRLRGKTPPLPSKRNVRSADA